MTSDPQREANRCNAQRSTGPQTVEGKQRSQLNAVKHGAFLSHNDHISATILQESPEEIDELYEAIVDDLDPQTALEATQAQAIAQQIINQQRLKEKR